MQYADDVKIYLEITQSEDVNKVQDVINCLVDWSKKWRLPLSLGKTYHLRIGYSNLLGSYNNDSVEVPTVNSVTDLGFHYDQKLDFSLHYTKMCAKAHMRTFQIFKALSTTDQTLLIKAYKIYVRPLVESGSTVFSPCKKKDIAKIEKVQNSFTRTIFIRNGSFSYPGIPRAIIRNRYFDIPSLESRRRFFDVCMVYKILHEWSSEKAKLFFSIVTSITRGGEFKIFFTEERELLSELEVSLFERVRHTSI